MTLTPFPPDALDDLALRLLDIAAIVRSMAGTVRDTAIRDFQLHGNKAHEWLDNLELWAAEAEGRLKIEVHRANGMRRGQMGAGNAPAKPSAGRRRKAGKKKG